MDHLDFWFLAALVIWCIIEVRSLKDAMKGSPSKPQKPYRSLHEAQAPSPSSKPVSKP